MSDHVKKRSDVFIDFEWISRPVSSPGRHTNTLHTLWAHSECVSGRLGGWGNLQMRGTAFVSAVQACLSQILVLPSRDAIYRVRVPCLMLQFASLCRITHPRLPLSALSSPFSFPRSLSFAQQTDLKQN